MALPRKSSPSTGHPVALPRKSSPNAPHPAAVPRKSSPNAPENSVFRPFWARRANFFALAATQGRAGRTFSRSHPFQAAQGELFRARSHSRPSRANFFAHGILPRSDFETNNTNARPQQGSLETGITSARGNRTKNADFSPAKATTVSDPRATSPTAPRHGAHGWRRHHRPQISHVIYRGHFLRHHKDVAIPAMRIQDLKQSQGNYVRNL